MTIPVKPISELEVKSTVSADDKILILDSVSEEARLADKTELKGDKGDKGDKWDTGSAWAQWPQWPKGEKWDKGDKGDKGDKWDKWDKGDKGDTWPQWPAGSWSWDVLWPSSATDWHLAVFDGTTGKYIKDWGSIGTAATKDTGTSSGNIPVLDANGHLASSTLPWVALTDTFVVSTSSDLTNLSSAEQWDIAIVTTENKTYVLSEAPYSTAANWKQILAPTGWVTSVNSQTWAVVLDADDISDSTTTNKFVTASDKTTWGNKQDALTLPATPTQWHLVTWWANNKSLADWGTIPTWVPSGWTDGQVLSKVSGSVAWANPSWWDVMVSSQANNILTTGMKIRAGTETNYGNLGTYDSNTLYLTIE